MIIQNFIEDEINLIISPHHPFSKKKKINKKDLYYLKFLTLKSNSSIQRFINNLLIRNQINPQQLNINMEFNSIEAIKTAVSLGFGAAFISSSAIKKELRLKELEVLQIENTRLMRTLSIVSNSEYCKSKSFEVFYNELFRLKTALEN